MKRVLIVFLLLIAAGFTGYVFWPKAPRGPGIEEVRAGQAVYAAHCASCHGADLGGQPDWQAPGPDGFLPAPPLNHLGHGYAHPEPALVSMVLDGYAPGICAPGEGKMPAFRGRLSEEEIANVVLFVKSNWTAGQRKYQREQTEFYEQFGLPGSGDPDGAAAAALPADG